MSIAPYVDDATVAVARVDLSRLEIGPLVKTLAELIPDAKDLQCGLRSETGKRLDRLIQAVLKAGGKDVYFTVSLGDPGPIPRVLAILPLPAGADDKAVRAALEIPAESGRHVGDSLVLRLPQNDNRPFEIRAVAAAGIGGGL